jgi:hypothetical protein
MDEDSILFQAMKNEMNPQIDQASMKRFIGAEQYPLGVEMRQGGPGGFANPLRMARPQSDFAGKPAHANTNPEYVAPSWRPKQPRGPDTGVIDSYRNYWRAQKYVNEREPYAPQDPNAARNMLQRLRDLLKGE